MGNVQLAVRNCCKRFFFLFNIWCRPPPRHGYTPMTTIIMPMTRDNDCLYGFWLKLFPCPPLVCLKFGSSPHLRQLRLRQWSPPLPTQGNFCFQPKIVDGNNFFSSTFPKLRLCFVPPPLLWSTLLLSSLPLLMYRCVATAYG